MKLIVLTVLFFLYCLSDVARAQFPTIGWSHSQTEIYMKKRYVMKDTLNVSDTTAPSLKPLYLYGGFQFTNRYGVLALSFNDHDKLSSVSWISGQPVNSGALFEYTISHPTSPLTDFADAMKSDIRAQEFANKTQTLEHTFGAPDQPGSTETLERWTKPHEVTFGSRTAARHSMMLRFCRTPATAKNRDNSASRALVFMSSL